MGKFADKMNHDLQIRGYAPSTVKSYLERVREFVKYWNTPPDELTLDHINRWQLHLTQERKLAWSTFNVHVCALRFFYTVTLQRDWKVEHIPYQKRRKKLPVILSQAEVVGIFNGASKLKPKSILKTTYSLGLRVGEVVRLRVQDIDGDRKVVRVEQGKGLKDRYLMLSPRLQDVLQEYWRCHRPRTWLFPHLHTDRPMSIRGIQYIFHAARKRAGIKKKASVHSLRHAFATHLMESGVNPRVIQILLGHASLASTQRYTLVARNFLGQTPSPLDLLPDIDMPDAEEDDDSGATDVNGVEAWTALPEE